MASTKKFYWLKLKESFFRDKKMKKLRRIAGGDTFTIIYLKMQLLSLEREGKLIYEGVEESFEEELALEIDEEPDNVKMTLAFLRSNGLIEALNVDEYILPQAIESMGSESSSAARMRKHRANKKNELPTPENAGALPGENTQVSQCDSTVTKSDTEIETELEKEKEIEIEADIQTNPPKEEESTDQLTAQEKDQIELIENLFDSWQVSNHKLLFIYDLARAQIPFDPNMSPEQYAIRVYDGLHYLTKKAKAEDVEYIYSWMQKLIPLTDF